ncbi:MAG: cobamide remodeling phosphodiesterase CbiR [Desulfovibrionaceae bacterium]
MMTASCAEGRQALPFLIAVPSWLAPGTVSENCTLAAREFAGKVQEISLMFLETEACLAYSREELHASWPEGAAPFSFHVHLPLDLPWHLGFEKAWEKCRALLQLCAPLQPRCYVLHPPCASAELLPLLAERFAQAGVAPENVLLENVRENDLTGIWPQIQASGFSCCLDLGHILAYGQEALLELRGLWERTAMLHLSAPDPTIPSRHAPLSMLDKAGLTLLRRLLRHLRPGSCLTVEVFDLDGARRSLEFLHQLTQPCSREGQ